MILHITDNIIRNIIFLAKSLCKICGKQSFKSEISTKQLISQCLSLFEAAFQEHTVKAQHMAREGVTASLQHSLESLEIKLILM